MSLDAYFAYNIPQGSGEYIDPRLKQLLELDETCQLIRYAIKSGPTVKQTSLTEGCALPGIGLNSTKLIGYTVGEAEGIAQSIALHVQVRTKGIPLPDSMVQRGICAYRKRLEHIIYAGVVEWEINTREDRIDRLREEFDGEFSPGQLVRYQGTG